MKKFGIKTGLLCHCHGARMLRKREVWGTLFFVVSGKIKLKTAGQQGTTLDSANHMMSLGSGLALDENCCASLRVTTCEYLCSRMLVTEKLQTWR